MTCSSDGQAAGVPPATKRAPGQLQAYALSVERANALFRLAAAKGTHEQDAEILHPVGLVLVAVAFQAWDRYRAQYPSALLEAMWNDPRRRLLLGARNKVLHPGSDFYPPALIAFLEAEDAVPWALTLLTTMAQNVVGHNTRIATGAFQNEPAAL